MCAGRRWAEVAAARQRAAATPSQPISQAQLQGFTQQLATMRDFYSKVLRDPAAMLAGPAGQEAIEKISSAVAPAVADKVAGPPNGSSEALDALGGE